MEADLALVNFDIAVVGLNFCGMLQALPAGAVSICAVRCLDAQLFGQRLQDRRRYGQRVFQEGAEITYRAELHGETQPVVFTAFLRDQCVVAVVQVEVTGEVVG
jgi:hypothetical protein